LWAAWAFVFGVLEFSADVNCAETRGAEVLPSVVVCPVPRVEVINWHCLILDININRKMLISEQINKHPF